MKSNFGNLAEYITRGGTVEGPGHMTITNCQADSIDWAVMEVHST